MRRPLVLWVALAMVLWQAITVGAMAQAVTLEVSPSSGPRGTSFIISASNLAASSSYTVDFVYVPSGQTVFSAQRSSDGSGRLTLSVIAEESDALGEYRVVLRQGQQVIAQTTFTIVEAPPSTPQSQPDPNFRATINIRPTSARLGATFKVFVSGLNPNESASLVVVNDASGQEAYRRTWQANARGSFEVELYTTRDNIPGSYTVLVQDATRTTLGSAKLTMEDIIGRNAQIAIAPNELTAGQRTLATITQLKPFNDVRVLVVPESGGRAVFTGAARANVEGLATLEIVIPAEASGGTYRVLVQAEGLDVAETSLIVQASAALATPTPQVTETRDEAGRALRINIVPPRVQPGQSFIISVTGLVPREWVILEVEDTQGNVTRAARRADVNGVIILRQVAASDAPQGNYQVRVLDRGQTLAQVQLAFGQAASTLSGVTVSITPESAPRGETHQVEVNGLNPGERVTLEVIFNDEVVFSTERTADAEGRISLALAAEEGDESGTYIVNVKRGDELLAQGNLIVLAAQATPAPVQPVTVEVSPSSGPQGTRHVVTVRGLQPNDAVQIRLLASDGRVVFDSGERRADSQGSVTLSLTSQLGDQGSYTVEVLRGGQRVAQADLIVLTEVLLPPPTTPAPTTPTPVPTTPPAVAQQVIMTVEPIEGVRGTVHVVTIVGLIPGETVTLDVFFQGAPNFTTQLTADQRGQAQISLAATPEDVPGTYDLQVRRGALILAEAQLVLLSDAAQTATPVPSAVTLSIVPSSGPVGTTHTLTISGLQPNETVEVRALFGGALDFTTQRSADNQGVVTLFLAAAPSDPTGDYLIQVVRGGVVVAEATLTVEPAATPTPTSEPPTPTPEPPTPTPEPPTPTPEPPTPTPEPPTPTPEPIQGDSSRIVIEETLSVERPEFRTNFTARAGEVVVITMTSDTLDSVLTLLDASGAQVAFNDDDGGSLNARIGPLSLPADGTYTIVASSYSSTQGGQAESGAFTLILERASVTPLSLGQPAPASFDAQTTSRLFSLDLQAGDVLYGSVVSNGGIDTALTLLSPDGTVVFSDDDGGERYDPEVVRYVVPSTGRYLLRLEAINPGQEGTVLVNVRREASASLEDGPRLVTLNSKITSDVVVMQARKGEKVSLRVRVLRGDPSDFFVIATQSDVEVMRFTALGIPGELLLGYEAIEDGTVIIRLENYGGGSHDIQIEVVR
ncbi:MAG: PPC domain-containing protein [Anaerolineae bacterium]|nr:PPC domain-containing protein [Anaerolineae bacterium]MDW8172159.1 hypothetical protein [Anaerolineae bacterium]